MPVSLGRILQSTPLFALEAVVLDTETTGLDPRTARIIEIGAVTLGGGRTTDRTFHSFVGLAERIPAGATAVHGITAEDIAGAPPFIRVYEDLRRFVGRRVVIGHTLGFDLAVLKAECERTGSAFHSWPTLDARMLAEIAAPTLASFSVDGLAAWLQVTVSERHRAIADAQITAEIFLRLVPKLRVSGLRTYGEAARACSRLTRMLDHHHQAGWVEPTADLIEADRHEVERRLDSYPYRHRVLDVMTRPPSFANESDALRAVLARMMDARLSSLLIGSPDAPAASAGIVTERDILMAIRERGPATLDEPVETLATRPLITVPADAFVYRAIGRMRRSHIRHLAAVADDGRIIGVLSARDLLRLRADAAIVLGDDLDEATDVPALARAWAKVPAMAESLLAEDVGARDIAGVVASELDALTRRAGELAEARLAAEGKGPPRALTRFSCWVRPGVAKACSPWIRTTRLSSRPLNRTDRTTNGLPNWEDASAISCTRWGSRTAGAGSCHPSRGSAVRLGHGVGGLRNGSSGRVRTISSTSTSSTTCALCTGTPPWQARYGMMLGERHAAVQPFSSNWLKRALCRNRLSVCSAGLGQRRDAST